MSRKSTYNVTGFVGSRKHASAAFCLGGHAHLLQQRDHILVRISVERAVKKFWISGNVLKKLLRVSRIGNIAAAFPRNKEFLS